MMFSRKTQIKEDWKVLDQLAQLDEIDQLSENEPVVIFKHSTTCGISAGAHHRLDSGWDQVANDVKIYYLDLLNYRPISNAIAERYDVHHQSPQILIVKSGKAIYHTSHHEVSAEAISEQL